MGLAENMDAATDVLPLTPLKMMADLDSVDSGSDSGSGSADSPPLGPLVLPTILQQHHHRHAHTQQPQSSIPIAQQPSATASTNQHHCCDNDDPFESSLAVNRKSISLIDFYANAAAAAAAAQQHPKLFLPILSKPFLGSFTGLKWLSENPLRQRGLRFRPDEDPQAFVTCQLCGNSILGNREINLQNHARRHSTLKQFQCCYCHYVHSEITKVRLHMAHNHNDNYSRPINNVSPEMRESWRALMNDCFPGHPFVADQLQRKYTQYAAAAAAMQLQRLKVATTTTATAIATPPAVDYPPLHHNARYRPY